MKEGGGEKNQKAGDEGRGELRERQGRDQRQSEGRRESSTNQELRGKGGMGSRIAGKGEEMDY